MLGTPVRGEFEHCEVALFVGKNPWMSHGIPHARTTLKAIANDPDRSMVVIDPRRTETAELADFHLQVRPGRDAWLLAAMAAVLVDESLLDRAFLAERASGLDEVAAALRDVPIAEYCAHRRRRRGPRAGRRPAHRRGVERRRVRGPRRADEPLLDARQLPREAGLAAHRQPRPARRPVLADVARQPRAHEPHGARPGDGAAQPGRRRPHHQRADPVQRDPRRDPHRPPAALPGDDRRVRQPGPLDRRQPADARRRSSSSTSSCASTCS